MPIDPDSRLTDAISEARERLRDVVGQALGAQAQLVPVLGSVLSRGREVPEVVAREFGLASAHAALEPSAFYDAAALAVAGAEAELTSALEALRRVAEGPNSLLQWCRASKGLGNPLAASLEDLLAVVRRARFARSEVTEVVDAELFAAARRAAEEISARLRASDPAVLPTTYELDSIVALVDVAVDAATSLTGLQARFSANDFRQAALLRCLEATEAQLVRILTETGAASADASSEVNALAAVATLEALCEVLLAGTEPFGQLLVLEAVLTASTTNLVEDVTLYPVPVLARGRRVTEAVIEDDGAGDGTLRARLDVFSDGVFRGADTEQEILVAGDEDLEYATTAIGVTPYLATGVASLVGEANASSFVSSSAPEISVFASAGALAAAFPAAGSTDKLAYVQSGPDVDLYYSDGVLWTLLASDVEYLGAYTLTGQGLALGQLAPVGTELEIEKLSGSGPAFSATAVVTQSGRTGSGGTTALQTTFSVVTDAYLSNAADCVCSVAVVDANSVSLQRTKRIRIAATDRYAAFSLAFWQTGRLAIHSPGYGWTHARVVSIETTTVHTTLELDTWVRAGAARIYRPRLAEYDFPHSLLARVTPVVTGESLDLRPGDIVVVAMDGEEEVFGVRAAVGDTAVMSQPVITAAEYREELAAGTGEHALLPGDERFVPRSARRFRRIRIGDKLVPLPRVPWRGSGDVPGENETYTVVALRAADGIRVRAETSITAPRQFSRLAVFASDAPLTTQYLEARDGANRPVPLFDLDRKARRLKFSDDPDVDFDDSDGYTDLALFLRGRPEAAEVVWDSWLRVSTPVPVLADPLQGRLEIRATAESRRAVLTVGDNHVAERVYARTGTYPTAVSLSATDVCDLEDTELRRQIRSGSFGDMGTPLGRVAEVLVTQAMPPTSSPLSGPVTRGGAREFPYWAWVVTRLRLLLQAFPTTSELREDIGRALVDLGATDTKVYEITAFAFPEQLDTERPVIRVTVPMAPTAAVLVGTDLFIDGAIVETSPPVRVVRATAASGGAYDIEITRLPATTPPPGPARLVETSVARAWREVSAWVARLDAAVEILRKFRAPATRVYPAIAQRLDAARQPAAAAAIRELRFEEWLSPHTLSGRAELAARLDTLVSSLLSRRRSPLDP